MRTRKRVADHGEVFTPKWLVSDMVDLVGDEAERVDSRFLEPACGSGNFLVEVLERRLSAVRRTHPRSQFERSQASLLGLMCLYGIELLPDNVAECRTNLLQVFATALHLSTDDELARAARAVLEVNIVQGDALAMTDANGHPLVLPEWAYLGRGRFQRRDFAYRELTQRSLSAGTLFDVFDDDALFAPERTWPVLKVSDIADLATPASSATNISHADK